MGKEWSDATDGIACSCNFINIWRLENEKAGDEGGFTAEP